MNENSLGRSPLASDGTAVEVLLGRYREYLEVERGLGSETVPMYMSGARLFMRTACGDDVDRVSALDASAVARFVMTIAGPRRASSVNTIVSTTRSLLRWFHVVGLIDVPLAQATPWLARGCQSTLPRVVEVGAARRLCGACDRATVAGARDYAIVVLLARLGLRIGEVLAIELDDIDWRVGEITVRSKGGARDRLPVPADVGDALAGYLRERGEVAGTRRVFVMIAAPHAPLSRTAAIASVRRLCARAGIANTATHRLRHSAARDLLRAGASLPEIGQVLRHQTPQVRKCQAACRILLRSVSARWAQAVCSL
jgi:site-specific recombinase XerD